MVKLRLGHVLKAQSIGMGPAKRRRFDSSSVLVSKPWASPQIIHMGVSENRLVPLNPMVLLIIIPMKNGYFIGNINPTFSDKPISIGFSLRNHPAGIAPWQPPYRYHPAVPWFQVHRQHVKNLSLACTKRVSHRALKFGRTSFNFHPESASDHIYIYIFIYIYIQSISVYNYYINICGTEVKSFELCEKCPSKLKKPFEQILRIARTVDNGLHRSCNDLHRPAASIRLKRVLHFQAEIPVISLDFTIARYW